MPTKQRVYWDSCVFIDWLQKDKPDRVAILRPIVQAAYNQQIQIITSALTLAEVIRCNGSSPLSDEDESRIIGFFLNPFITVRNVDRRVASEARRLCRRAIDLGKKVPPADAIHIATACLLHVDLHTFDDAHLTPHDKVFGDPPIGIVHPHFSHPVAAVASNDAKGGQRSLFDAIPDSEPDALDGTVSWPDVLDSVSLGAGFVPQVSSRASAKPMNTPAEGKRERQGKFQLDAGG